MKKTDLQIVTLEQAKILRHIGFNYPTESWYGDYYDDEDHPIHEIGLCTASMPSFVQNYNDDIKFPLYDNNHINYWNNVYSAPTLEHAIKWLRDEKQIAVYAFVNNTADKYIGWSYEIILDYKNNGWEDTVAVAEKNYNTYEEALSDALTYILKILSK